MLGGHRLGISPRAFLSLARFLAAHSRKILRESRKSFFEHVLLFFAGIQYRTQALKLCAKSNVRIRKTGLTRDNRID